MTEVKTAEVRVLIVDDDAEVRAAVTVLVNSWPGYRVVGVLDSAEGLARAVILQRPDVVLLDLAMPGRSANDAIEDLGYRGGAAKVLVLSGSSDPATVRRCLQAGAIGYVLKEDGVDALRSGLAATLAGVRYLSPGLRV